MTSNGNWKQYDYKTEATDLFRGTIITTYEYNSTNDINPYHGIYKYMLIDQYFRLIKMHLKMLNI